MERNGQAWFMVSVAATTLSVAIQLGMVSSSFFAALWLLDSKGAYSGLLSVVLHDETRWRTGDTVEGLCHSTGSLSSSYPGGPTTGDAERTLTFLTPRNWTGRATFSSGRFSKTRKGLRARRSAPKPVSILLEMFPKKSFERCYF